MIKRLFVTAGIFGLGIFLLLLPGLARAAYALWSARATGIGVVSGFASLAETLTAVAALLLLATLAYWLSGKLVKA